MNAQPFARIAHACHDALRAEADATPKPGLVDKNNSGAHTDMDHALFLKSADALYGYFYDIAALGADTAHMPHAPALTALRARGARAEEDMLLATRGVNTHKGAIFSMGLLAAAAGRLFALHAPMSSAALMDEAALYVHGICKRELGTQDAQTKGERAYARYRAKGARGEAEQGFPNIRAHGLPAYHAARVLGIDKHDALINALMHLMAHVGDTNVMTRRDERTARYAQNAAAAFLYSGCPIGGHAWRDALIKMDADFIARNISPGGCADLAACAYFLHEIESLFRTAL